MAKPVIIEIILSSGVITPEELRELLAAAEAAVPAGGTEGVVLSGRMPVWAFAALAHLYHPRPWVGTFDPRLGGGVVVASHVPDLRVGDVVVLEGGEATVKVAFPAQ